MTVRLGFLLLGPMTLLSALQAWAIRPQTISIEAKFGIASYLPVSFWITFTVAIIGVWMVRRIDKDLPYVIALLMLTIIMWDIPTFALELPFHQDGFWHMSVAQWLTQNPNVDFRAFETYTRLAYLQYPSLFLLTDIYTIVALPDVLGMMIVYQFSILFLFTLNYYILSRLFLGSPRNAFIACLLTLAGNGAMFSNHFAPSSIAESVFPLLLFTLVQATWSRKKFFLLCTIILASFYALVHPIMPLLYSIIVVSLGIIFPYFVVNSQDKDLGRVSYGLILALIIPVLYWNLMIASWGVSSLQIYLSRLITTILTLGKETALESQILQRQVLLFPDVGWIKRIIFISMVLPAFSFSMWKLIKRKLRIFDLLFLVMAFLWFISSLVTDLSDRLLVWIVPFAAIVIVDFLSSEDHMHILVSLRNRILNMRISKTIVLAMFVLLATLTFATSHSCDAIYITTRGEYTVLSYFVYTTPRSDKIFTTYRYDLYFYKYTQTDYLGADSPQYADVIPLALGELSYAYWIEGKKVNSLTIWVKESIYNPNLNRIYSNDVIVFRRV